jgi:hypothetical protein
MGKPTETNIFFCDFSFEMLVLFETPAGFALFKMLDDGKLAKPEDLSDAFGTPEAANKMYPTSTRLLIFQVEAEIV